jgi:hypothetical protein
MNEESKEREEAEAKEVEQMQLALVGEEAVCIDYSELAFHYTGERFKSRYPGRYKLALKLIATGQFSDRAIGKFVHADQRTIFQVRMTSITDIEEQRALVKQKAFTGIMVLGDKTLELADAAKKPSEAAIPMGIFKDVYLQVSGQPTANIRVDHHFDFHGAIDEMKKEADAVMKQVKGRVIEPPALVPPQRRDGAAA